MSSSSAAQPPPLRTWTPRRSCTAWGSKIVLLLCLAVVCYTPLTAGTHGSELSARRARPEDQASFHRTEITHQPWWTRLTATADRVWHVNQTECVLSISTSAGAARVDGPAQCRSGLNLMTDECIRICTSSCRGWVPWMAGRWILIRDHRDLQARREDCPTVPPPLFGVAVLLALCCICRSCFRCCLCNDSGRAGDFSAACPPKAHAMPWLIKSNTLELDRLVPLVREGIPSESSVGHI